MSEYQYYEFQSLDRKLTEQQMRELRAHSSRARITSTSFVNDYSFGDFKGNEDKWMEKYFDAFLYVANWGTHILQLRVPAKVLSTETAKLYCFSEAASVRERSGNLIVKFVSLEEDGGGWVDAEGTLALLLPVRDELIRGDVRALYLGWLLAAQQGELDEQALEAPVPPNLGNLTGSLSRLVDFLRIDPDLLTAAGEASPSQESLGASPGEMAAWVASLPGKDKNDLLIRLMKGDDTHVGAELCRRFNRQRETPESGFKLPPRTVGELLATANAQTERRRHQARRTAG